MAIFAATKTSDVYFPIEGRFGETGTRQAVKDHVMGKLAHVFLVDEEPGEEPTVLVDTWFDAAGDESPEEFAERLFAGFA